MKRILKTALLVCLALSLVVGLFACGGDNKTPADKGVNNGQTTPSGGNGDETITVNGDNELPLIPLE